MLRHRCGRRFGGRSATIVFAAGAIAVAPLLPAAAAGPTGAPAPPAPTAPADVPFEDQAAGRRLLFSLYDAYHTARTLAFDAHWLTERADGSGAVTGSERLEASADGDRLAVTTETDTARRSVRRAIAGSGYIIATDFEDHPGNPTRQFVRLPLEPGTPLPRALALVQFAPHTFAARLRLDDDWMPTNADRIVASYTGGAGGDVVTEIDAPSGPQRTPVVRTVRYTLERRTHVLLRYEEWVTPVSAPARAGNRKPKPPWPTYRREDYHPVNVGQPIAASLFSQKLPATYQEVALPSVHLPPPPPAPQDADARSLAALRRWRNAQQRPLSLNVEAQTHSESTPRTEDSRPVPANRQAIDSTYTLWIERPDRMRLHLTVAPGAPPAQTALDLLAVSDGSQMAVYDAGSGAVRRVPVGNINRALMPALRRQNGPGNELFWLLFGPPAAGQFDRISLDDTGTVLTLVRKIHSDNGRGRTFDTTQTWRVTLGPDDVPQEIDSRTETDVSGMFERDLPPITTSKTRFVRFTADSEPPIDTFTLPKPPPPAAKR